MSGSDQKFKERIKKIQLKNINIDIEKNLKNISDGDKL